MSELEVKAPDGGSEKAADDKQPPIIRKAVYWLGGCAALLTALTVTLDGGTKFIGAVEASWAKLGSFFSGPVCTGDMSWEERKKCDQKQGS